MDKMKLQPPDLVAENVKKIAELFPNCVTETKGEDGKPRQAINFEMLRQMLADYVVEGDEAYEFTWVGKKAAIVEAHRPIRKTLRPCPEESKDWDTTQNLYIEGDNLEVLKLLQESYLGKVKMIYIDPPYNTGNDFIYRDNFTMGREEWSEESGEWSEDGERLFRNTESNGRFHSDWCSMMYSRLMLARNLLSDDGVIFVSIDDNEINNTIKICNEVFGERNFIAQITLLCNPKGRSQDKYIANCHEYILIYSRNPLENGKLSIPKSFDEIKKDYPMRDEEGNPYREMELRNTHRDFGRFNRPKLWYPIFVRDNGTLSLDECCGGVPVYPIWDDGFEGCWTWGIEKSKNDINLLFSKKVNGKLKIYRKAYAYTDEERPLKQVKSIWTEKLFFTEKGQNVFNQLFNIKEKFFQSPKSVSMIHQCILMIQSKNAIILDFFSGSATTAHAVMELNAEDGGQRQFIMVQLQERCPEGSEAAKAGFKNICEIGKERIRRAGEKIKREASGAEPGSTGQLTLAEAKSTPQTSPSTLDVGFRVFKVDDSNMKDVYYAPADLKQEDLPNLISNIKEDRTALDLLFGCLLDWGLPLSLPYFSEKIGPCTVHTYNQGDLIACFDANIPESVIREIAKRKPLRAVFRDAGFADSPAKINVFEIFKHYMPESADDIRKRVKVI